MMKRIAYLQFLPCKACANSCHVSNFCISDTNVPKKRGRGRPKGSSLQKKVNNSADDEVVIPDNPSNVLEVDPEFREELEEGMMK